MTRKYGVRKKRLLHCVLCGTEFYSSHSKAKYCDDECRLEGLRASNRRSNYRAHDRNPLAYNAKRAAQRRSESGKKERYRHTIETRKRFPEKNRARYIVANALKYGKLVKQPCSNCGSTHRIHAHHDDYSKPLDIQWLCDGCHRLKHPPKRRPNPSAPKTKIVQVSSP